jgi:cell division protein FtsX
MSSIESSVLLNERIPVPGTPGTLPGLALPTAVSVSPAGKKEESKIIRHILRVHEDIKAAMKAKDDDDTPSQRFPIIETGLFISVGLFVLIVMNMMLRMGKNHVSYRFTME